MVYRNDRDREELSTYPTIYDHASEAGLRTAGVNWPVTRNAESLYDNFPDAPSELSHMTPRLRSELIDLGLLKGKLDVSYRHGSPQVLITYGLRLQRTSSGRGRQTCFSFTS